MKPVRQVVEDGAQVTVAGGLVGRQEFPHPIALRGGVLPRPLRCHFCGTFLKLDEHGVCAHCGGPPKGWDPHGAHVWDGTPAEFAKAKEQWRQASRPLPKPLTETSRTVR